jgi:hypothetical protein
MKIEGKKIVALEDEERATLQNAINLLNALSDAVGNDEYFDFDDVADTLYYIRSTDKFEVSFEQ